ncbi:hypothetical protein [Conexibacter sp. SYSU D00693]|uniref:hypothetical protein n=1 Tax=Conexibacter sp. SYSU D00693 TaxID=2812560 RepID=UPI00196ACE8D|nr:hypothetical protein [Conexibacter sp. SYSU D00693]
MRHLRAALLASVVVLATGCGDDGGDAASTTPTVAGPTQSTPVTPPPATTTVTPGTETGDAPAPVPEARRAFVAQVDAFCRDANREAVALNRRIAQAQRGVTDQVAFLGRIAPILDEAARIERRHLRSFERFEPPSADAAGWRSILADARRQVRLMGDLAAEAADRDVARFVAVNTELQQLAGRRRAQARAFGLRACGGVAATERPQSGGERQEMG